MLQSDAGVRRSDNLGQVNDMQVKSALARDPIRRSDRARSTRLSGPSTNQYRRRSSDVMLTSRGWSFRLRDGIRRPNVNPSSELNHRDENLHRDDHWSLLDRRSRTDTVTRRGSVDLSLIHISEPTRPY